MHFFHPVEQSDTQICPWKESYYHGIIIELRILFWFLLCGGLWCHLGPRSWHEISGCATHVYFKSLSRYDDRIVVLCTKRSSNSCQTVVSIGKNVNFFRRIPTKRSYGLREPWNFFEELVPNGRGVRLRLQRSHDMTWSIFSQFPDILNRDKSWFTLALCKNLDTFTFYLHFVRSSLWFLRDLRTGPSGSSLPGDGMISPFSVAPRTTLL
jgi:hypothetical protein